MNHTAHFNRVLDSAAACRTYREFCARFPLDYHAANHHGWLEAVMIHCGWTKHGTAAAHDTPDIPLTRLEDILNDHDVLFYDAINDPLWPIEMAPIPLKAEIA